MISLIVRQPDPSCHEGGDGRDQSPPGRKQEMGMREIGIHTMTVMIPTRRKVCMYLNRSRGYSFQVNMGLLTILFSSITHVRFVTLNYDMYNGVIHS